MPSRRVTVALAVAVPTLILGTIVGAYVWGIVSGYRAILAGPKVDAVVIDSGRCTGRAWQCGRARVAVQVQFHTARGSVTAEAAAARPLPVGEHVLIQHDPKRPERRVLIVQEWERQRERDTWALGLLVVVVASLAALAALAYVRSRRNRLET